MIVDRRPPSLLRALAMPVLFALLAAMTTVGWAGSADMLAAGMSHNCALQGDGTVACWGSNSFGQLGTGSVGGSQATPSVVAGLGGVTAISAGAFHSCALKNDTTVACWGNNSHGQLGNGNSLGDVPTPVTVTGLSNVTAIAAGGIHSCALKDDDTVVCWGDNGFGQLGSGVLYGYSYLPQAVAGLTDVMSIGSGLYHTCVQLNDDTAACWGKNIFGQLGRGSASASKASAEPVVGLSDAIGITAGEAHSCAWRNDGTAACWGRNDSGELGIAVVYSYQATPATVTGMSQATMVSAGGSHSCALKNDGTVACWGYNGDGQLGAGSISGSEPILLPVTGLTDATEVAAGGDHTCALKDDGAVHCWGLNDSGQLGTGSVGGSQPAPVIVTGFSGSADASLSGLALTSQAISPPFDAGTYSYTANADAGVTSVELTAMARASGADVDIAAQGGETGGSTRTLSVAYGDNLIDTVVTAEDGVTQQTYSVTVTRALTTSLISLTMISPGQTHVGQPVTVSFSVTGDVPTGTVTISSDIDGDLSGCTGVDVASAGCVVDAGVLTAGTHQFSAHYSGDGRNLPGDSSSVAHVVIVPPPQIFESGFEAVAP